MKNLKLYIKLYLSTFCGVHLFKNPLKLMKCPLCSRKPNKTFMINTLNTQELNKEKELPAIKCSNCGLTYLDGIKKENLEIYDEDYAIWGKSQEKFDEIIAESKRESFSKQINLLLKHIAPKGKKLLDIGTGKGFLLDIAKEKGFDCYGLDISDYVVKSARKRFPKKIFKGQLEEANYKSNQFDVVTLTDFLEHLPNPNKLLKEIKRILKPEGLIMIICPDTDSVSRKFMGKNWFQYRYEHLIYFNRKSIKVLFNKHKFKLLEFKHNSKRFSIDYYHVYFNQYSVFMLGKIFKIIYKLIPNKLKKSFFTNPVTGELITIAKNESAFSNPKCFKS